MKMPATVIASLALLLAACGGEKQEEPPPPKPGVFDDMTGTIDKANEVEQKVMDQKDRMDEALDEAEGDTSADEPE